MGGRKTVYTYHHDGRTKEKSVYIANKLSVRYRYSYEDDDNGNWIVMRELMFDPAYSEAGWSGSAVTYREIAYFNQD